MCRGCIIIINQDNKTRRHSEIPCDSMWDLYSFTVWTIFTMLSIVESRGGDSQPVWGPNVDMNENNLIQTRKNGKTQIFRVLNAQLMDSRLLVDPCIESEYEIGRSIRANNKRYVRKRREHKEQLAIASRTDLGQAGRVGLSTVFALDWRQFV